MPGPVGRGGSLERGIGNAWFKFSWELHAADTGQTGIELGRTIKSRSGDWDKGLGPADTDVALQLDRTRPIGRLTAFGEIGHRRTGDVKHARPYRDPWYGEIGLMGNLAPHV